MTEITSCAAQSVLPEDPLRKLMIAVSILQGAASESYHDEGGRIWGDFHFPSAGTEHAINILISVIRDLQASKT